MKYYLTALICLFTQLYNTYVYGSNVVCSFFSDPVVFGRQVVLSCVSDDVTSCVRNQTRMWFTGQLVSPVLFNGVHDDERYSEEIISCSEFHLAISNFSEIDLNDEYVCAVGFETCRLIFNMSNYDYEFHPTPQHIDKKHLNLSPTFLSLQIDIQKVYPVPECFVRRGNITHYIAIPQNVSTVGHIFKTSMNLMHDFKEEICPVDIYIWCLVGRTSMEIAEKHFTNCTATGVSGSSDVAGYLIPPFLLLIAFLFCDCPVLSSLYRNRAKIWNHLNSADLLRRNCWDWRRPVLATVITVIVCIMDICTIVYSMKYLVSEVNGDGSDDIAILVILCVSSLLLTPLSLCLISTPATVSIRKGFVVAGSRFDIKKTIHIPCNEYEELPLVVNNVNSRSGLQPEPDNQRIPRP